MTAAQWPMWTLPIPPANPFYFEEASAAGTSQLNTEQAPPEPPPAPPPSGETTTP